MKMTVSEANEILRQTRKDIVLYGPALSGLWWLAWVVLAPGDLRPWMIGPPAAVTLLWLGLAGLWLVCRRAVRRQEAAASRVPPAPRHRCGDGRRDLCDRCSR